jgi:predicted CXXCH cytochrome family protein
VTDQGSRFGAVAHLHIVSTALLLALSLCAAGVASAQPRSGVTNGCLDCHSELTGALEQPARLFLEDVHRDRGFGCVDCHGGDPATLEKDRAKDPARGYRGVPAGTVEIETCARCHSDAVLMRRFMPRQRIDQAAEYWTSGHGKGLLAGDGRVATCSSCHDAHGIRLVTDARAPVYRLNVAATCARCHSDPEHMKGSLLPIDQRAEYEKSVHYDAMVRRHDLSAPTCNDCHGNHGAAPPGVDDVANVCGTCHAVFQMRYEQSVHSAIFGCAQCHDNHAVLQPSDDMLGATDTAVCAGCHENGDAGLVAGAAMRAGIDQLVAALETARHRTDQLKNAGMEMGPEQLALAEARNQLTLARTEIHAFDPAVVAPVLDEGLRIVANVEEGADQAFAELRFRRRGLAVSLVLILVVLVALALKLRELDRRHGVHAEGS